MLKSPGITALVTVMLVIESAALPEFVKTTDWLHCADALTLVSGQVIEGGASETVGAMPLPLSGTVRGLPFPAMTTVSEPTRKSRSDGVKVTTTWHGAPGESGVAQLVVETANSPVALTLVTESDDELVFVIVVRLHVLDVRMSVSGHVTESILIAGAGVGAMVGAAVETAIPRPLSGTDCGLSPALSVTVNRPTRLPTGPVPPRMATRAP